MNTKLVSAIRDMLLNKTAWDHAFQNSMCEDEARHSFADERARNIASLMLAIMDEIQHGGSMDDVLACYLKSELAAIRSQYR